MSRRNTPTFETLNRSEYNKALKRRGSLTIWFHPQMAWAAKPTGKLGRQPIFIDATLQTCLAMNDLLRMALRQTTGFAESLLRLFGLAWEVPDFSTLSRRQKALAANNARQWTRRPRSALPPSTATPPPGTTIDKVVG